MFFVLLSHGEKKGLGAPIFWGKDGKKKGLSRRELNPGLERCRAMTSSHTDHYTTEDLLVWAPAVAESLWELASADAPIKLAAGPLIDAFSC